jgi:hypothetical protein
MAASARQRSPSATADPFLPELAERLNNLTWAGFDATLLVRSAAAAGPLPDDHPAAALWRRVLDQLSLQVPIHNPGNAQKPPNPLRRRDLSVICCGPRSIPSGLECF